MRARGACGPELLFGEGVPQEAPLAATSVCLRMLFIFQLLGFKRNRSLLDIFSHSGGEKANGGVKPLTRAFGDRASGESESRGGGAWLGFRLSKLKPLWSSGIKGKQMEDQLVFCGGGVA